MNLNLSIGKILLLVYIIISSSYCSNLFSNGLKQAIESNRYAQHLILLILIMSLMILFGNPFNTGITNSNILNVLIMSLLVYGWFILTTKLDLAWNIGIIVLLAIYFLWESNRVNDINIVLKDSNVQQENKTILMNNFINHQNYILLGLFGITLAGTMMYSSEKQVQYGGGFNFSRFWFN
jgi:hypothetical protein